MNSAEIMSIKKMTVESLQFYIDRKLINLFNLDGKELNPMQIISVK